MASKWDKTQKRIMAILGQDDIDDIFRSDEHLQVYLEYLKNNVEHPSLVTGMEDFPWEEKYVFGYGDEQEYEKLKKTNPSYTDTFTLIELELVTKADGHLQMEDDPEGWAFIHAVDLLVELRAEEAIPSMVGWVTVLDLMSLLFGKLVFGLKEFGKVVVAPALKAYYEDDDPVAQGAEGILRAPRCWLSC